jgi:Trypsin-like peptidase domain
MSRTTLRPPAASRVPLARLGLLAVVLIALTALAAGLIPRSPPRPPRPPLAEPLRVTSGNAIATGFAIGRDRVVTVAHVVEAPVRVGGIRARVLRVDRRSDLALLAVPGVRSRRLSSGSAAGGERVRVGRIRRGRTSMRFVRVRRTIVAHVSSPGAPRPQRRPALELATLVAAGDSGAPVLTGSGALAGVIFAASRRRPDTAYAVDAAAIRRLLRRPTRAGA